MAKKKASTKKKSSKRISLRTEDIGAASALLFAGASVIVFGIMQGGHTEIFLIGYGAALESVAGVIFGLAIFTKN